MVSDTILGALIGGGFAALGTLLSSSINYVKERQKMKHNSVSRYAERLIEKKLESLSSLHSSLVKAEEAINDGIRNTDSYDIDRVNNEIEPVVEEFEKQASSSSIFLNKKQQKIILSTVKTYYAICIQISEKEKLPESSGSDMIKITNSAKSVLSDEVNGPIKEFEQNLYGSQNESTEIPNLNVNNYNFKSSTFIARQKSRISEFVTISPEGVVTVDDTQRGDFAGAMFLLIGHKLAYEADDGDTPFVSKLDLVEQLGWPEEVSDDFFETTDHLLVEEEGEYSITLDDLDDAVDWAIEHSHEVELGKE